MQINEYLEDNVISINEINDSPNLLRCVIKASLQFVICMEQWRTEHLSHMHEQLKTKKKKTAILWLVSKMHENVSTLIRFSTEANLRYILHAGFVHFAVFHHLTKVSHELPQGMVVNQWHLLQNSTIFSVSDRIVARIPSIH